MRSSRKSARLAIAGAVVVAFALFGFTASQHAHLAQACGSDLYAHATESQSTLFSQDSEAPGQPSGSADDPSPDSIASNPRLQRIVNGPLNHRAASVDGVEELYQGPELPTGCESVALTIVLHSHGFDLPKTEIADNYLSYGDNLALAFSGDPHEAEGTGVFSQGIVDAANAFLDTQETNLRAYNLDGTDIEGLYKLIDAGYAVVVWSTSVYDLPEFTGETFSTANEVYSWYINEHCVVLYGYDLNAHTVYVSDPNEGYLALDADDFTEMYDQIGRLAMTVA